MAEISAMFSLSRPLCLMLIWLAASVLAATSFHLAGYNRAAAILRVGVSVFTFTIPASGLLADKWLLSCCQCPYHNFLWLLEVLLQCSEELIWEGHLHVLAKK